MEIKSIIPNFKIDNAFEKSVKTEEAELEGLSERQKLVYKELKKFEEGATAKELAVKLYRDGKTMYNERNAVHPRLNELIKLGLVDTVGKKTCQYTDKRVTIYKIK